MPPRLLASWLAFCHDSNQLPTAAFAAPMTSQPFPWQDGFSSVPDAEFVLGATQNRNALPRNAGLLAGAPFEPAPFEAIAGLMWAAHTRAAAAASRAILLKDSGKEDDFDRLVIKQRCLNRPRADGEPS